MRNDYLSLHQFEPVAPYTDSLLVSTYSPHALDVAVPYAASRLIVESLASRLLDQFGGRTSYLSLGASSMYSTWDTQWFEDTLKFYNYPVHYGIVLTDRILTKEWVEFESESGTKWIVFDWWQWIRRKVPAQRYSDAIMFLCQASEEYVRSPERSYAGIPDDVLTAMQQEGNRLFGHVERVFSERLFEYWGTPLIPDVLE